ncbi:MAG: MBL fold metallo-hydrolase [Clostridia bacterium]|nr:MBL fold metallo-hydrolase [Clostridia bacterium]
MRYDIISTGSKGNAVVINDIILIDCGVSFKALKDVYKNLKIVLLTHEHSDHINKTTIKRLASERPTIRFACGKWLINKLISCGVDKSRVDIVEPGKKYNYGAFAVSPVKLYHDVPNCGYRIYMNEKKLFYATDTNTLEGIVAKDYDLYMVEANYVDEEIKERIRQKEEKGEYVYEYGAMHAHLSKQKCDDFICENIGTKGRFIYLHGHEERR